MGSKDEKNGRRINKFILDNRPYNRLNNIQLVTSLIKFYGKIGEISKAMEIFDATDDTIKNVVCYNAMMQTYLEKDMNNEVINL